MFEKSFHDFFFISAFSSMFSVWTTISLLLLPNLLQAQEYDVSYDSQECPTKAELGTNQVLKNLLLTIWKVDLHFFSRSFFFHISVEKTLQINIPFKKHYILTIFLKNSTFFALVVFYLLKLDFSHFFFRQAKWNRRAAPIKQYFCHH